MVDQRLRSGDVDPVQPDAEKKAAVGIDWPPTPVAPIDAEVSFGPERKRAIASESARVIGGIGQKRRPRERPSEIICPNRFPRATGADLGLLKWPGGFFGVGVNPVAKAEVEKEVQDYEASYRHLT